MAIPRFLDPNARNPQDYAAGILGNVYQNGPQTGMVPNSPMPTSIIPQPEEGPGILGRIGKYLMSPRGGQQLGAFGAELLANSGWSTMPASPGAAIGRGLQAAQAAGRGYDQMIGQQAADAFNKRIKEAELRKMQAETAKLDKEASGAGGPFAGTSMDAQSLNILLDPNGGQRWVVYDEAWRLMSHPALLRRMDAHWRLARHYGIANMLIFHKLTDLDNVGDQGSAMRALASSLLANAETRVVYRQESDQLGATAAALGLTGTEQSLLPTLGTGQGLWRIKHRSFVVQHQLQPAELDLFDTTGRMNGAL